MLISIETHILCEFPGGVRTPYPPLDPHMLMNSVGSDQAPEQSDLSLHCFRSYLIRLYRLLKDLIRRQNTQHLL